MKELTPSIPASTTDTLGVTGAMGALSGLKVIDLSRVLGGPLCAQTLADH
ncbi:MAG: hypothetical protein IV084_03245, partial [Rugosibacter sp.]|nr:hypothetical protein [Rugosibacter sp.]